MCDVAEHDSSGGTMKNYETRRWGYRGARAKDSHPVVYEDRFKATREAWLSSLSVKRSCDGSQVGKQDGEMQEATAHP